VAIGNVGAGATVVVADLHVEAVATSCDGLANAAQADDAEFFATDSRAQWDAAVNLAPAACTDEAIAQAHAARTGDHQAPGQISHAIGQHIWCVADENAAFAGGIDVDGFIADPPTADGLEIR